MMFQKLAGILSCAEIEENRKNVREMVMESYHDMQAGK